MVRQNPFKRFSVLEDLYYTYLDLEEPHKNRDAYFCVQLISLPFLDYAAEISASWCFKNTKLLSLYMCTLLEGTFALGLCFSRISSLRIIGIHFQ
jgi:hypothetical protein